MMRLMCCKAIAVGCWLAASAAYGQLTVSVNDGLNFVLGGTVSGLLGIEFTSDDGLVPGPDSDAGPFGFLLSNNPSRITFGSLSALSIDGEVVLPAGLQPGAQDIGIEFGTTTDRGYLVQTQTNPQAWHGSRLAETRVNGISFIYSASFRGEQLAPNQIGLSYGEDTELDRLSVSSFEWADDFVYDGSSGSLTFRGETMEFTEGEFNLPAGWKLTDVSEYKQSCKDELEFVPDEDSIGSEPTLEFGSATFMEDGSDITIISDGVYSIVSNGTWQPTGEVVCREWTNAAYLVTASAENFVAAPEPASAWLFGLTIPFVFLLRKRR